MEKNRNFFIDIIKGVAIFLMLWGHCIQYCVANSNIDFFENGAFKFIYSFHMPLFMLVSGYLFFYSFSKRNLKEIITHRTHSLLQPIILCSFFNFLIINAPNIIMNGNFTTIFDGGWIKNISSLWFLWSVLAASLVTALICKKFKNVLLQIVLFVIAIPIVALFPNMTLNVYMYPYFIIGFYFAQYKDRLPTFLQKIKYLSLPLFPILLCFYEKKHYIYTTGLLPNANYSLTQMIYIDTYRWLIGLVGAVFVITVLQILYQLVIIKSKKALISTSLSALGRKSLQIYALSIPFLSNFLSKIFPKALSLLNIENIFVKNMFIFNFIFTFSLAIAYAFILYFIIKLLDKLKITKILFGK